MLSTIQATVLCFHLFAIIHIYIQVACVLSTMGVSSRVAESDSWHWGSEWVSDYFRRFFIRIRLWKSNL